MDVSNAKMKERAQLLLQKAFRIRKGEVEKTLLMSIYAFNWLAAFVIGRVLKSTLFLRESELTILPYTYIIGAIGVFAISFYYHRQLGKHTLRNIVNATMILIIVMLLLFRYLLTLTDQPWVVPGLFIFIEIMGAMLGVQFWTFANDIFNTREAKRLFGFIAGGQVLANLYSFPIKFVKDFIGINNLIFVCIFSLIICVWIFNYLSRKYRVAVLKKARQEKMSMPNESEQKGAPQRKVFSSLQNHLIMLTAIMILSVVFVEYQFLVYVKHTYTNEALGDFFLNFFFYTGIIACFIQFFLTSRIIEKTGILGALLFLPIALFGGSIISILGVAMFVGGAVMTKGAEQVTRYTLTETTTQILYHPLPPAMRRRVKAVEYITRPSAQITGGILLIALNYAFKIYMPERVNHLSWAILALVLAWVGVLVSTRQKYIEALLIRSKRKKLDDWDEEEDEKTLAISRIVIQKALSSEDETQIINALEVIPMTRWTAWDDQVLPLLYSHFPKVRMKTLEFLGKSRNRKYSRRIQRLFEDENESVRSTAVRVFCALEQERAVPVISSLLTTSEATVKAATITGLIRYGGLDGIMSSTAELKAMLDSEEASERKLGAQVLGYIKIKSFYQPLFHLINDERVDVRISAIQAAGEMRSNELIPSLIYKLQFFETKKAAVNALARYGNELLPYLEKVLILQKVSPKIQRALPQILGYIATPRAFEIAMELIEAKDIRLRSAIIQALMRIYSKLYDEVSIDLNRAMRALHAEMEHYYITLHHIHHIRQMGESGNIIIATLEDHMKFAMERIFNLLGMIFQREQIEIVQYNFRSGNPSLRANASEIIDNICDAETKRYLLPILDTIDTQEKALVGRALYHFPNYRPEEFFESVLVADEDEWLVASVIHTIAALEIQSLKPLALSFASHHDPIVREAVLFAAFKLTETEQARSMLRKYVTEQDETVKAYRDWLGNELEST